MCKTANVSNESPLLVDAWAFVYHNDAVLLAKVKVLYTQSTGKGARHAWHPTLSSIGAPSYIVVQLYERAQLHRFRPGAASGSRLHSYTFAQITRNALLTLLDRNDWPKGEARSGSVDVSQKVWEIYAALSKDRENLKALMSKMKSRQQNQDNEE
ncbi:hypothetical protein SISNIDRAFT_483992 [Sistotremastrum niveocremeum HHB9708]|uniref:Uncharacterized protein n=1 Tax=Sistotremastrum niveocremeum HHB9708 TaxID=1314777 RepID=A0A164WK39_9AGAM|nr:hypothetical protein SISNIDRAFT_489775 [Sistotremastrum niveocremeum HHB9708]KZS95117.1 hypothetical protein SISNIDRAFT_483992 [Sistotremastrum niveocremeum HHB9708]